MLAKERHDQIIAKLNLEGNVRVKDLSRDFDVTEDCIRKDLTILEREGKLKRMAITWELYRYLNNLDVNVQQVLDETYVCIDDETMDIDSPEEAKELEKAIKE